MNQQKLQISRTGDLLNGFSMHELGIARELFSIVLKASQENSIRKVSRIVIRVGENSGIDSEFLRHSFEEHLFPNSIAQNATLRIIKESVKLKCKKCGKDIKCSKKSKQLIPNCPVCNNSNLEVISGKDIYVESIESNK